MQGPIDNASSIVFNIHAEGIAPGSLTAEELDYVLLSPRNISARTTFTTGATSH